MADAGTPIRLFVSSTFADFQRERELLQRRVFPVIRKLCLAEGVRFLPIDLRWGVSEQAGTAQRTLPIIFEELARCQRESPEFSFLLLLGDRYGSRLLPDTIPTLEYDRLLAKLDEGGRTQLAGAYRLDQNAVPPTYVLRPRPTAPTAAEREAADAAWQQEVAQPLLAAFRVAATLASLTASEALKYTGSVTHLEVQRGLLDTNDPSVALCVFRRFTTAPTGHTASEYVETDPAGRAGAAALKAAVNDCLATYCTARPDKNAADLALTYTAGWEGRGPILDEEALVGQLCAVLERRVRAVIAQRQAQARGVHPTTAANARFAAERVAHFVGREELLGATAGYLAEPADVPLVVAGPGGAGKSTLLAKAVAQASAAHPEAVLLVRYIGVTPGTASTRALLDGLRSDLANAYGHHVELVREDYERTHAFRDALGWATAKRPLILVLDALDQLGPPPLSLDWLPEALPPHVHLIVSLLDEADRPELPALMVRQPPPLLVSVGKMEVVEGDALLSLWLGEAGRTLQQDQRTAVLMAFASEGRPLYLKLAFEEARRWRSFDPVADLPPLAPTIHDILTARFVRLERPEEHGPVLTGHTLGLLRAANNGLAEDELLLLLARDAAVRRDLHRLSPSSPPIDEYLPLPTVLWARLYDDLGPYLTERETDGARLLTFYHRQLADIAADRYLRGARGRLRHRDLARYFEAQPLFVGTRPNLRKLSEQPFQQAQGGLYKDLRSTLTDATFLQAKIAVTGTAGVVNDIDLLPDEDMRRLGHALQLGSHILDAAPQQLLNQVYGRLGTLSILHNIQQSSWPPLRLLSHSLTPPGGPLIRTLGAGVGTTYCCAYHPNGILLATLDQTKLVKVWDSLSGQLLQVLRQHQRSATMGQCSFSPDGRLLAYSAHDEDYVYFWTTDSWNLYRKVPAKGVIKSAFGPDGQVFAVGCSDRSLRIWSINNGGEVCVIRGFASELRDFAFGPNGNWVVGAFYDGTLHCWSLVTGEEVGIRQAAGKDATNVAISPDGRLMASSSYGGDPLLWNPDTGELLGKITDSYNVRSLQFSSDSRILGVGQFASIRLYDVSSVANGSVLKPIRGFGGQWRDVFSISFSPDGKHLASAGLDQAVHIWNITTDRDFAGRTPWLPTVNALAFSPNGTLLACGQQEEVNLREVQTGQILWKGEVSGVGQGVYAEVNSCSFSQDGAMLATAHEDGQVILWETTTGKVKRNLSASYDSPSDCAFSPDGRTLAFVLHGFLSLWDTHSMCQLFDSKPPAPRISRLARPTSGRDERLIFGTAGNDVVVLSIESGELRLLYSLQGHTDEVTSCAFSPDGRFLASTSRDRTLRVWDTDPERDSEARKASVSRIGAPRLLSVLKGHTDEVTSCAFSPDGRFLASTSRDRTLRVWSLDQFREIGRLPNDTILQCCAWKPQNAIIAAGGVSSLHILEFAHARIT